MTLTPSKIRRPEVKYRLHVIETCGNGESVGHVSWFDTWPELVAEVERRRAPWIVMEISVSAPKQWVLPSAQRGG